MSYTKQTWVNDEAGGTPISAARLNYIETGVFGAHTDPIAEDRLPASLSPNAIVYDVRNFGADEGAADNTPALQAACDAAAASGGRVYGRGTFNTTGTLTIECHVDLGDLTIRYGGTGLAVRVGDTGATTVGLRGTLPRIQFANAPAQGWVAGTTGLEITNLFAADLVIPNVQLFERGVSVYGRNFGVAYCQFRPLAISNNQVNWHIGATGTGGFSNQNVVHGGRFLHGIEQGTQVAGTRHVQFVAPADPVNAIDAWTFIGTSLESPNVVEYHVEVAANNCQFIGCRWENTTPANTRVWWRAGAQRNLILGGVGAQNIVETFEAGAKANEVAHPGKRRVYGGDTLVATETVENATASTATLTAPTRRVLEPGATVAGVDPATAWVVEESADGIKMKRAGDAYPRVHIEFRNNRILYGPGTAAPTIWLGAVNATSLGVKGHLLWDTDNIEDLGTAANRPRYVRAGTGFKLPVFTTAGRPAAATVGAGTMIFDSSLGYPVTSNGTAYVNGVGTVV